MTSKEQKSKNCAQELRALVRPAPLWDKSASITTRVCPRDKKSVSTRPPTSVSRITIKPVQFHVQQPRQDRGEFRMTRRHVNLDRGQDSLRKLCVSQSTCPASVSKCKTAAGNTARRERMPWKRLWSSRVQMGKKKFRSPQRAGERAIISSASAARIMVATHSTGLTESLSRVTTPQPVSCLPLGRLLLLGSHVARCHPDATLGGRQSGLHLCAGRKEDRHPVRENGPSRHRPLHFPWARREILVLYAQGVMGRDPLLGCRHGSPSHVPFWVWINFRGAKRVAGQKLGNRQQQDVHLVRQTGPAFP